MSKKKPSYQELKARLEQVESTLEALRRGEIDIVITETDPILLRCKSVVDELDKLRIEAERLAYAWQVTFDATNDTIWHLDMEQRIVRSNKIAERTFQLPMREIVGKHCYEIVHGTKEPIPECPFPRMRQSLQREILEMWHGDRCLSLTVDPVIAANKKLIGAVHIAYDITERKKAEETIRKSEEMYRCLIDNAAEGISVVQDGAIKFANNNVSQLTGYTIDELKSIPAENLIHPEDRDALVEYHSKRMKGVEAPTGYSFRFIDKNGNLKWLRRNVATIVWDGRRAALVFDSDITESKRIEQELARSNESLQKTMGDIIDTMVKIVETRDPYTAGHQQRVAALSIAIAREMNWDDTRIKNIGMAALIHDIGKIYVPAEILSKPGKLSGIEMDMIRIHSQRSYDIIKGTDLSCTIKQAALQHHERLDGSGYPNRLKGDQISLEAKILAVADTIEAMCSHRPYRPARSLDEALAEISENRNKLYDSDVVDATLRLFKEKGFTLEKVS